MDMTGHDSTEKGDSAAWFFVPVDDSHVRKPADVAMAVVGALIVFITALRADQAQWVEDLLETLIGLLPTWLASTFTVVYAAGFVYALLIVGMAISQWRSRGRLVRDLAIAAALTSVILIILTRVVSGAWPIVIPELVNADGPLYPVSRVAGVTAILMVGGSQLVRPMRRIGWVIVTVMFIIAMALGYGLPADALGGIGVGLFASGAVLATLGSSRGLPDARDLRIGFATLGVEVENLTIADQQSWGARAFNGVTPSGEQVHARVYGRDARDAQMVALWWRSIWYRDSGPGLTSNRLHMVEHEALLSITAGRAGVPVQNLLAAGEPTKKTALVAFSARGLYFRDIREGGVGDDVLVALWESVGAMHASGIAHGRLNENAVRIDGTHAVLENFSAASAAAPEERVQGDVAELLSSLSVRYGTQRAVSVAREGLGEEALIKALPFIQRSAVSTEGRKRLPSKKSFFSDIRDEITSQTGAELAKAAQLTRMSWRTVFMFALTFVAGYALLGMLVGIDFASVWEELQNANWGWIAFALIVATSTLASDAFSMMAAVSIAVPLKPTVQLESAIKFIQLAIGGAAGRMATNVAYLRKFGVSAAASVTQGGVDSLTGFLIQSVILVMAILFGNVELKPDDASIEVDWVLVLGLLLFAVVVSGLMVRFVPAIRDRVLPPAKQMWDGLRDLGTDPSRLVRLFGANLASQLLFGLALWMTAFAFGWTLPYMSVVVVYVVMALLGGLLPIPGGVGVSEAILTAGLTAVGVDESAAFAIAVTFRVISAYLPPVWGWYSLRWLQRNEYL
jgi:uncharacterized protein (TIRG00374 family)